MLQSQLQNLRDNLGKVTVERDGLKKELEAKTLDIQEKLKTITQVKKLGRRYKTQYEELKVGHEKASRNLIFWETITGSYEGTCLCAIIRSSSCFFV